MIRTQIYLTETEKSTLANLAMLRQRGQSELIRQAIDDFIARNGKENRLAALRRARGMWAHRDDLPDIQALRDGWPNANT